MWPPVFYAHLCSPFFTLKPLGARVLILGSTCSAQKSFEGVGFPVIFQSCQGPSHDAREGRQPERGIHPTKLRLKMFAGVSSLATASLGLATSMTPMSTYVASLLARRSDSYGKADQSCERTLKQTGWNVDSQLFYTRRFDFLDLETLGFTDGRRSPSCAADVS